MQNIRKIVIPVHLISRKCATSPEILDQIKDRGQFRKNKVNNVQFCKELFGFTHNKATKYAIKYPEFQTLDPDEAKKSFDILKSLNIPTEDIINVPAILTNHPTSLLNRSQILFECGFTSVQMLHLHKYLVIVRRTIDDLKLYKFIEPDTDVGKSILNSFQLEASKVEINSKHSIEFARKLALNEYLKRVLNFNDKQVDGFWFSYNRVKHRSAKSIIEMIKIVKEELGFTNERIRSNSFLLYGDPEYLKEILKKFPRIGGMSIIELLNKRPKICMVSPDAIAKTLSILEKFNIQDKSLLLCPDVLTLGPQTVENRLRDLTSLKEFNGLLDHPRVLKLVLYQIKAKARLQYLQQLKFKCASLHILSSANTAFEKYTREGADKTKGNDIVAFIAHNFKKTEDEIREIVNRHPNWTCVPIQVMKSNFNFLTSEGFTTEDIFHHVFLIAYPTSRIEEKLEFVRNDRKCQRATRRQQLSLILYFIELDFHFTGDGVWTDYEVYHGAPVDVTDNASNLLSIDLVKFGQKEIDDVYPTRSYQRSYKQWDDDEDTLTNLK
uniref:CSON000445 protein n=1 Tax=Culicoides sonorensis TaxID=179676 RepID=A0A336MF22_CULSO